MSTIITAGNATNNGASLTSAADGELEFKTGSGAGTTALTLSTSQIATFSVGALGTIFSGTTVASTSGTSIDFTGIPAGVKRITVMFNGVSTNAAGSSAVVVQLGVSGTAVATGYTTVVSQLGTSTVSTTTGTTAGFPANQSVANAAVFTGQMVISNLTGNTWVASSNCARTDSAVITLSDGSIALAGVMNLVRITTANGTDTFDAGSINILYE